MKKTATFSKSEREHLLVEMQNIPMCLRFQSSASILFPSQLAFIHSLTCLSPGGIWVYHPSPPMLQPWSFFPWRWRRVYLGCYSYSPPWKIIPLSASCPIDFIFPSGGGVCLVWSLALGTYSTPLHLCLCQIEYRALSPPQPTPHPETDSSFLSPLPSPLTV